MLSNKNQLMLAFAAVFFVFFCGYGCSAMSYRSECVKMEASIKAQHTQNKNVYDNNWKKFREMAQIPEMYTNDLKKLYDGALQSRYGAEGSKAVFQFIQEHNPQLDSAVYTKLQAAIEAGRNEFSASQATLIDKKREYETLLNGNQALFVNVWFGFPRIDLDQYGIVTSEKTEEVFKSGKDNTEIKLR